MKKGLIINEDAWALIDELESDEQTALLSYLALYHRTGDAPEIRNKSVRIVFKKIQQDNERFSDVRSEAGKKGADARWQNVANMANDGKDGKNGIREEKNREDIKENPLTGVKEKPAQPARTHTVPPTLEEVEEYVRATGLQMDPAAFFDHFTSNGWKVSGKAAMKDWRAACRNWARNEKTMHPPNKPAFNFTQRTTDYDALLDAVGG